MANSHRPRGVAIALLAAAAIGMGFRNGAQGFAAGSDSALQRTLLRSVPADLTRDAAPAGDMLSADPAGWVDVTPHVSLEGWTRVPIPPDKPLDPVTQWKLDPDHGMLLCEGNHGHEWLRYDRELANFLLHVEWRFEKGEGLKGYNSGVFVRNDLTGRVWHQAQVGELAYIFGQTLAKGKVTAIIETKPLEVNPLRPVGEWNTYEIRCQGPKITLWVNDKLTGEFTAAEVPKGYWGLEAEGYRIEFRNLKLKTLP